MSKKGKPQKDTVGAPPIPNSTRRIKLLFAVALITFTAIAAVAILRRSSTPTVTFAHDVAPLIYARCAACHRTGGAGPFPLISYSDVAKRAAQLVKVTQSRYMPPWLPAHGYGDFEGERYLSDNEILLLKNWSDHGAREGDSPPPPPQFADGWQLGKPDLVVQLPRPYMLSADGRDDYRNFAIPIPIGEDKFIKGFEFNPGSSRIHHAFLLFDPTPASRRREGKEAQPGWPGVMALPPTASGPSAQFATWQPGKVPRLREDFAWRLNKGADLVLQLHMQPGGKIEPIQPSVAFYFADRPGSQHSAIIPMRSVDMDIPAGEKSYPVHAQYTVPVDMDLYGVLPHVHYLGKDLRAAVTLPDGTRKWLLWIKDWDFNWQGEYTYKQPVFLPQGSRVDMDYIFDNSVDNPRNPSHPPKRVQFGTQSTDEMAEFWMQLVPRNKSEDGIVAQDCRRLAVADQLALGGALLRQNPANGEAHLIVGKGLLVQRNLELAETHLRRAVQFDPNNTETHYYLAYALTERGDFKESIAEYSRAINLDRENYEALNGLGRVLLEIGKLPEAEAAFAAALRLQPNDTLIQANLSTVRKALGK